MIVVIMGVCGAGKTAVGQALATDLGTIFRDADEFHSTENIKKMSKGIQLTDDDRLPWLQAINTFILQMLDEGSLAVVTCSALKQSYRHILMEGCPPKVQIIYLKGSKTCIQQRLEKRTGHFMPAELLSSQFMTLEEPNIDEPHCKTIHTDGKSVCDIVKEIKLLLGL